MDIVRYSSDRAGCGWGDHVITDDYAILRHKAHHTGCKAKRKKKEKWKKARQQDKESREIKEHETERKTHTQRNKKKEKIKITRNEKIFESEVSFRGATIRVRAATSFVISTNTNRKAV